MCKKFSVVQKSQFPKGEGTEPLPVTANQPEGGHNLHAGSEWNKTRFFYGEKIFFKLVEYFAQIVQGGKSMQVGKYNTYFDATDW